MTIHIYTYKCHGRKSNLVEFQILGLSTKLNINLVESPIGVSTGRKSNRGDLGISLGVRNLINLVDSPTAQNLDEETILQALHAETNNWAVVTRNAAAET